MDEAAASPSIAAAAQPPSSAQCLDLFSRVWRERRLGAKALDMALQVRRA